MTSINKHVLCKKRKLVTPTVLRMFKPVQFRLAVVDKTSSA